MIIINIKELQTQTNIIEYLKDKEVESVNFINNHTRPQLAYILRKLYPCTAAQLHIPERAFSSMCKKRQCRHIKRWLYDYSIGKNLNLSSMPFKSRILNLRGEI